MIFGCGTDITEVQRFSKWIENSSLLERFFSSEEIAAAPENSEQKKLEYFASRFASKEAFVKALGTGFKDFSLKEISVKKNEEGKPFIYLTGNAENVLKKRCGECAIHLSISHEKEYAVAFVIIEK